MLYPSDPAFPRVLQSSAVLIPFPTGQPKRASNASCTAAGSTVEPADAASASNLSNMLYPFPPHRAARIEIGRLSAAPCTYIVPSTSTPAGLSSPQRTLLW